MHSLFSLLIYFYVFIPLRHCTKSEGIFVDGTGSEASTPPGSPQAERAGTAAVTTEPSGVEALKRRASLANLYRGPGGVELGKDVLNNITTFRRKQKKVSSAGCLIDAYHI